MRLWLWASAGGAALVAAAISTKAPRRSDPAPDTSADATGSSAPAVALVRPEAKPEISPGETALAALDLRRLDLQGDVATAPAGAAKAELALDPALQRAAASLLASERLPEAAVVLLEVATGRVLVYASHVDHGSPRDLCADASAPSASLFKIVTAAALVEDARLGPDTEQCYSGGEQRIEPSDLVDDPRRDRWCTTLAGALGRSINAVFARLASRHLSPEQLEDMARRFGYGEPQPYDVAVRPGELHIPRETLEFARTAAGFWNTTLSPLQAVQLSATIARHGESLRPVLVDRVVGPGGAVLWSAPEPAASRRVVARETAAQVALMMTHTVREGTSYRAFHDGRGVAYLPGIAVAAKTGTLTDHHAERYYTWFSGFAPADPRPGGPPQVALAVLVVNGPTWRIKANGIARDVLRLYFSERGAPKVTRPAVGAVARRPGSRLAAAH